MRRQSLFGIIAAALFVAPALSHGQGGLTVPVEYHKLDNGLKVVLSTDPTTPIVTVAVYYNIGFRIEPRDRTGFAHLFEHMMFQGSESLPKGEFDKLVEANGGILNGSTRFDFTNYFEVMPSHMLETTLWAEADRMKGLAITQAELTNQQGVVKNEVKVNVLNRPYGGFPWLDMPQYANENWYNAHNFYGDLEDLDAATLEDVQAFFDLYYSPNNAALVVVGDFDTKQALAWIEQYFSKIPSVELPDLPNLTEPKQEQAKTFTKEDQLANRPALAFAYHMPERNSAEYFAMGLIDQILVQGEDSRLYQALVQREGLTGEVSGAINMLGNMFNYNGPMLWMAYLYYDADVSSDQIMDVVRAEIEQLAITPVDQDELDRALVKFRAELYDDIGGFFGIGRADLLACFALFDDDPNRINTLEEDLKQVTPELIMKTVQEYLQPTGQTILVVDPKAGS